MPTTSYHHVLQQRGSKRGTREGGRSHSSVTLRRREEEEPTEQRKRRQREQTQRGGSQAVHFLYSKKASSAHRGLCAPLRLFFFLLFHPLSFSFSYKILQSGMRENNNSVSFTTGYVNTFQNQLLLKPSNKYKRKKKTFFPIPQGPGTSQRLSLHKHAQCFRTPLTGGNKRCGVVEISQPSTGEKKRSLKERHLLQHAFMRGFAC